MAETPDNPRPPDGPVDLSVPWLEPYREAAAYGGASFGTLLWKSEVHQRTRFRVFAEMIDLTERIVIDCGCGRADLLLYLAERKVPYRAYVGIDALPVMVEHCNLKIQKQGLERARVFQGDFVPDEGAFVDCIRRFGTQAQPPQTPAGGGEVLVFSGSLNTCGQDLALRVLDRAWRAVEGRPGGAVAFNFLSMACGTMWRGVNTGPATRFDPVAMLSFALQRTPRVLFRQEYLDGHDASIVMLA